MVDFDEIQEVRVSLTTPDSGDDIGFPRPAVRDGIIDGRARIT